MKNHDDSLFLSEHVFFSILKNLFVNFEKSQLFCNQSLYKYVEFKKYFNFEVGSTSQNSTLYSLKVSVLIWKQGVL
jgi:hypothetical protein